MKTTLKTLLCYFLAFPLYAQTPAVIETKTLGALDNPNNFDRSTYSNYINYGIDLNSQQYVVRLPADYDAQESYGLILYISSGNGGNPPSRWEAPLDQKRIIWIGAKGLGNDTQTNIRHGAAIMSAFRATELYSIDPERIYLNGSSGGSRVATAMGFMRSDFFDGVISTVGIAFPKNLPEKFIEPDPERPDTTYYEYALWGGTLGVSQLAHRADIRFALTSFYNDFREDETSNCYHLGMVNHGNQAKLIIRPGGHNKNETESFIDALNFIEHPNYLAVFDDFSNNTPTTNLDTGSGWTDNSSNGGTISETTSGSVSALVLTPNSGEAKLTSNDSRIWFDEYGSIFDTQIKVLNGNQYGQNSSMILETTSNGAQLRIDLFHIDATTKRAKFIFKDQGGTETEIFSVDFDSADEPANRSSSDDSYYGDNTYTGRFKDFRGLNIKLEVWDTSYQVIFGQDLDPTTFTTATSAASKLLDDGRTITGRWNEIGLTNTISSNFLGKPCTLSFSASGSDGWAVDSLNWVSSTTASASQTPVAENDNASLDIHEESSILIDALSNDSDPDDAPSPLSISSVGTPSNGIAVIESGFIRYTPNTNFTGTDTFNYSITDGSHSATANISVDVSDSSGNSSLLIHWKLDETSGLAAQDSSSSNNNGTVSNPTWSINGVDGSALQFNGESTTASADLSNETLQSYTLSMWVKKTAENQNQYASVVCNSNSNIASSFQIDLGSGYQYLGTQSSSFGPAPLDEWVHLAVSCNGTDTDLYYNGNHATTLTSTNDNVFESIRLGVNRNGNRFFQGHIDDFRLYKTSLSATVIQALYQASQPSLHTWQENFFSSTQIQNGHAGIYVDFDLDGVSNLMEYLMGTNPTQINLPLTPKVLNDAFVLPFTQQPNLNDWQIIAEASEDLINWNPATIELIQQGTPNEVKVQTSPLPATGRFFYRLRAIRVE